MEILDRGTSAARAGVALESGEAASQRLQNSSPQREKVEFAFAPHIDQTSRFKLFDVVG